MIFTLGKKTINLQDCLLFFLLTKNAPFHNKGHYIHEYFWYNPKREIELEGEMILCYKRKLTVDACIYWKPWIYNT